MWEELNKLRQQFQNNPDLNTEIYKNHVVHKFLYETLKLANNELPEQEFEEIISQEKRPQGTSQLKAYDLWHGWQYVSESAREHKKMSMAFVQQIAAKVMKHTGGETTTSVGRYDSSLGDFRLGADYDEVYSLADYRNIPALLESACRKVNAQINQVAGTQALRLAAGFVYEFAHIKPFGAGNLATGLLAMNYIQLYHNEPPLILHSSDRIQFLNALKRGKISQNTEIFEDFMAAQQIRFFKEQLGL